MHTETHSSNEYYRGSALKNTPIIKSVGSETNVDFIYEYSDLNYLHTRVRVLSGEYENLILEFGSSTLTCWNDKDKSLNEFSFDYTIYSAPDKLLYMSEEQDADFKEFLTKLLCDVVGARKNDPKEHDNFTAAIANQAVGTINIDKKFYYG